MTHTTREDARYLHNLIMEHTGKPDLLTKLAEDYINLLDGQVRVLGLVQDQVQHIENGRAGTAGVVIEPDDQRYYDGVRDAYRYVLKMFGTAALDAVGDSEQE